MKSLPRSAALALALLLGLLVWPGGAASARAVDGNGVVRADIITEVQPLGRRIVAVAVQYDTPIHLRGGSIPTSTFEVTATLNGVTAVRGVVDVYVNARAERHPQGGQDRRSGRFVIIELGDAGPGGAAAAGAVMVRQIADIVDAHGRVQLPASPFAVTNQGVITAIVDSFASLTYTDSAGTTLPFRLFRPQTRPGRTYPLVVFLHGAGERGTNNLSQMTANQGAVTFAAPRRQATDPSFVLAPQAPADLNWTTPKIQAALLELIDTVTGRHPVDRDRLYLTGLSMGGIGSFDILPRRPDMFASALLVAARGDVTQMPLMTRVPVWATHSVDDPIVNYTTGTLALVNALEGAGARTTRGEWPGNLSEPEAESRALRLWDTADEADSHVLLTTYPQGTTPESPHSSWVPTYSNDVMLDWLFSHRLADRTTTGPAGDRPAQAGRP